MSLKKIDLDLKKLTEKAKLGKLTKENLTGGTFTITNLGMYDVNFFIPIINPPEAAILAVGKIIKKPCIIDGEIKIKPLMTLSLAYDHRIVGGAPAAKFLGKIKENLETLNDN